MARFFLLTPNSVHSRYIMKEFGMAEAMASAQSKFIIPVVSGQPELPDFLQSKRYFRMDDVDLISKIHKMIAEVTPTGTPVATVDKNDNTSEGWSAHRNVKPNVKVRAKRTATEPQYWFLKINPDTWNIFEFVEDFPAFFNTHDLQTKQRIDYDQFIKVKKDDKAIGYAFGSKKIIACVFVVTEEVHVDTKLGEGISLRIESIVSPPIPLGFFEEKISFSTKLSHTAPERLFPVSKSIFDLLLSSVGTPMASQKPYVSTYTTEGDHKKTQDQLSFTGDIESFGTVICLKNVQPPLAIGLFGKWGSGKSFFMEKLGEYIEGLALSTDDRYVPECRTGKIQLMALF